MHRGRPSSIHRRPLGQCRVQDVPGERVDQPGVLGGRQKLSRGQQPEPGVLPAHQRLDAAQLAVDEADLGLVVQDELTGIQGAAQFAEQRQPGGAAGLVGRAEGDGTAAFALCGVHRDVGALEELDAVGAVPVGGHGADAGLHAQLDAADVERRLQGRPDLLGGHQCARHPVDLRQQDGELVTAEPGDGIGIAQRRGEPPSDLDQHGVTHVVAQAVVDVLEPVQVDQQQPGGGVHLGRGGERLGEAVRQQQPIRQPSQRVVLCLVLQGPFQDRALGDVPAGQDEPADGRLGPQVTDRALQVPPPARAVTDSDQQGVAAAPTGQQRGDRLL